jgi:hypothetical protein
MVAPRWPGRGGHLDLSKLAYLTLCRSIQLLVLLARGRCRQDLEILVLRHQLTVLRRHTPCVGLEPADRALLAALSRVLPRARWSCFSREARDAAALAPAAGRRRLDLPASPDRSAAAEPSGTAVDRPPGQGEPGPGAAAVCPSTVMRPSDDLRTKNRPAFALVRALIEPPAGIEPATPSLPWIGGPAPC